MLLVWRVGPACFLQNVLSWDVLLRRSWKVEELYDSCLHKREHRVQIIFMLSLHATKEVPIDSENVQSIPFSWPLRCHGILPLHLQELHQDLQEVGWNSCKSGRSALEQLAGPLYFCTVRILHCLVQLMAQVSRLCVFALCDSHFHMTWLEPHRLRLTMKNWMSELKVESCLQGIPTHLDTKRAEKEMIRILLQALCPESRAGNCHHYGRQTGWWQSGVLARCQRCPEAQENRKCLWWHSKPFVELLPMWLSRQSTQAIYSMPTGQIWLLMELKSLSPSATGTYTVHRDRWSVHSRPYQLVVFRL